jgi:hypothetical protein
MTETSASEPHPELFHLTYKDMSPFSSPFFWGKKRGLLLPTRAAVYGREPDGVEGGTGKEAAKLQDVGISLKQAQENEWQKKQAR